MRILTAFVIIFAISLGASASWAQSGDRARRGELAVRFVELSFGDELPRMVDQLIEEQLAQSPDMPEAERNWMRRNMPTLTLDMVDDLARQLGPLYAEAFTTEELEALVAFYETPLGRSIATKQFEVGARSQDMLAGVLTRFFERLITKYCQEFECEDIPTVVASGK